MTASHDPARSLRAEKPDGSAAPTGDGGSLGAGAVAKTAPSTVSDDDELSGLAPGQRVGRYTLVARLASGGMAHVWTAEPEHGSGMSRTVAVKIIRPELAGDKDYARMFVDEATIATAIEHPNVCQTFELDQHEGNMYMAMEWVPGDSLGGMLRDIDHFAALAPALAARICADACAGLHAAHEALDEDGRNLGVIHRDVSPPNILISLQGQVKVSDFGIAKARHQLHERTKTGEVKGKFGYLAPEQITGTKGDRRIDIYAMGCVLYVATMGLRPFGNGPKAMTKILLGEYRRPSKINPNFPPGLEAIIVKALSHEPGDRFQTAGEMREALERWLIETRQIVTASDVARELVGRMHPEALEGIKKLQARRRGNRAGFGALLEAFDELEPPTAASGLVQPPSDLQERARRTSSLRPEELLDATDDVTTRTASRGEDTVREQSLEEDGATEGSGKTEVPSGKPEGEESGWHRAPKISGVAGSLPPTVDISAATATVPPHKRRPLPRTEGGLRRKPQPKPGSDLGLLLKAAAFGVAFALVVWFLLK